MTRSAHPSFLVRRILAGVFLFAAAASLLLPYVHQRSIQVPRKFRIAETGYEYPVGIIIVLLLAACAVFLFGKKRITAIAATCVACVACCGLYPLWYLIFFNRLFCDCGHGIGFYVLSCASLAFLTLSIIAIIRTPRGKSVYTDELLDELPDDPLKTRPD